MGKCTAALEKKVFPLLYLYTKKSIINIFQYLLMFYLYLLQEDIMAKEIHQGTVICQNGQPVDSVHMIIKGKVRAIYQSGEFILEKGDVIGLCDLYRQNYIFTYTALDDVTIASFPFAQGGLSALLRKQQDFALITAKSCFKQTNLILEVYELIKYDCSSLYQYVTDSYREYCNLCERHRISPHPLPALEEIKPLELEDDIPQWMSSYYENMAVVLSQTLSVSQTPYSDFLNGLLLKTSQDISDTVSICHIMTDYKSDIARILMNENRLDLFDLYMNLFFRVDPSDDDSTSISAVISRLMIHLEGIGSIDHELYQNRVQEYKNKLAIRDEQGFHPSENSPQAKDTEDLTGSIHTILQYSECDKEICSNFLKYVDEYKDHIDKNATDDANRKLRLNLTKLFYKIYESAFLKSLQDDNIPIILKMFFQFGYVDEKLAGMENAAYLYSIAEHFPSNPEQQIYTAYEWMEAVYRGEKEPSRNEFDMDYPAYVRELKTTGKITAAQEKEMIQDNMEKLKFELGNMFPLVNKMTFGRITTFCPVFSEHNVLKELDKGMITAQKVSEAVNNVRAIDFGAYYRETVYANPAAGIAKEYISTEVLPDVILMPNIGIRGVMWQEIEGKRRTTPARMMISIFHLEDLTATMTRLTGEFRWEMCRRVQGPRWNDVSEPSLTSEYFDYIQFYKKNHDLTADAKDKIKAAMQKAKNSYKEMFVRDYLTWIIYEGNSSPRLNKVARAIIATYCPFSKEIRDKLAVNPLYKDMLEKYNLKISQKIHHMDNLCQKLNNTKIQIPAEILNQKKFLES